MSAGCITSRRTVLIGGGGVHDWVAVRVRIFIHGGPLRLRRHLKMPDSKSSPRRSFCEIYAITTIMPRLTRVIRRTIICCLPCPICAVPNTLRNRGLRRRARFARGRGAARILKGHPGSGKTTALLYAADSSQADRVLYLTFSQDLAALARDYFDRFCSKTRTFTVLTYPAFISQLLGGKTGPPDGPEARALFRRDLFNHQRSLGAWSNNIDSLYEEMHAHLIGAAVPQLRALSESRSRAPP